MCRNDAARLNEERAGADRNIETAVLSSRGLFGSIHLKLLLAYRREKALLQAQMNNALPLPETRPP